MLAFFGFIDFLGAIILLALITEIGFPVVIILIVSLILIGKSLLNLFSLAGLVDVLSGLFLLSSVAGVNLSSYSFLVVGLAIILVGKAISSFLV